MKSLISIFSLAVLALCVLPVQANPSMNAEELHSLMEQEDGRGRLPGQISISKMITGTSECDYRLERSERGFKILISYKNQPHLEIPIDDPIEVTSNPWLGQTYLTVKSADDAGATAAFFVWQVPSFLEYGEAPRFRKLSVTRTVKDEHGHAFSSAFVCGR